VPESIEVEWINLGGDLVALARVCGNRLRIAADPRRPAEAAAAVMEIISKHQNMKLRPSEDCPLATP
jgi:hypothetical protein